VRNTQRAPLRIKHLDGIATRCASTISHVACENPRVPRRNTLRGFAIHLDSRQKRSTQNEKGPLTTVSREAQVEGRK
jgi:hypothetical protein